MAAGQLAKYLRDGVIRFEMASPYTAAQVILWHTLYPWTPLQGRVHDLSRTLCALHHV